MEKLLFNNPLDAFIAIAAIGLAIATGVEMIHDRKKSPPNMTKVCRQMRRRLEREAKVRAWTHSRTEGRKAHLVRGWVFCFLSPEITKV